MPKRWHIGPDVDVGICINGDRRLRLEYDKSKAYFDGSLAGQPGPKALRAAQQAGVKYYPLNGSSLSSRMRDEFFTPIHAVSGGGWSGEFFALPGGTVFAPSETTAPRTFFNRIDKPNTTPSAAVWRQNVGAILMQDPVLRFITAAALAAPVLRVLHREGFSLQITGNNAAGGEPLLHVAASIVGDPARKKAPYYESFDPEAPTFTTLRYEDLPIIIRDVDEVLAVSKLNEKDRLVSTFLKRTGATDNITSPKGLTGPAVRIFTAFRPIAHLTGDRIDLARAYAGKLITLDLDRVRCGFVDRLPEGFSCANELGRHLSAAADQDFGVPMRKFVRKLVQGFYDDPADLRARLQGFVDKFRQRCGVDLTDQIAVKNAETFGVVYAAGQLAVEYGVLPPGWNSGAAALFCYRLSTAPAVTDEQFMNRLLEIGNAPSTLLCPRPFENASEEVLKAVAFKRRMSDGDRLIVRPEAMPILVPGWADRLARGRVPSHQPDKDGHATRKVVVFRGRKDDRYICFDLPHGAIIREDADAG